MAVFETGYQELQLPKWQCLCLQYAIAMLAFKAPLHPGQNLFSALNFLARLARHSYLYNCVSRRYGSQDAIFVHAIRVFRLMRWLLSKCGCSPGKRFCGSKVAV